MRILLLFTIACFVPSGLIAQTVSSLRSKNIALSADTIQLDTLSIAPGSLRLTANENFVDTSAYTLDFINARIIWNRKSEAYKKLGSDSIQASYRVFSFLLSKEYQHKGTSLITGVTPQTPIYYNPGSDQPELFKVAGLTHSGSISRGITFGNNQDVFVNSSLNLQLAGKLSDNVEILAAITDENIPVQPEGNTQQLQDFDKVFIQVSNNRNKLIAGDFELKRPDSYFMNFYKKGQGGYFTTEFPLNKNPQEKKRIMRSGVSFAVSKGKFSRYTLEVKEGNQGPYRLRGNAGESYIVILSGTEKIYFDGQLLDRGSQYDYVIDYNTAELTFTAKRLITKDSRIVAEFEYSDKNYARTLIFLNNEFESEKLKIKLNVYSEQDSKNQPLSIDLDSTRKAVMAEVGDSIQYAFYPNADSIEYSTNSILYKQIDTVTSSGIYQVYVYSTNADSAYWRVSFSEVGLNRGDYIIDLSSVNGRIYKWIEPVGGIPQGNYAPVSLLITPKKQQLFTTGIDYAFNKRNSISVEGALSNYDVNLFSNKDKYNDVGYATRILYRNIIPLSNDTITGWKLDNVINYEYASRYFKPIERFRNVEFERDWNLGTNSIINDEHIAAVQTTLSRPSLLTLGYMLRSYNKGAEYKGLMNSLAATLTWKKFTATSAGSYLNTNGLFTKTKYLRHSADISRPVWKLILGIRENAEDNRYQLRANDSLQSNSFAFQEIQAYIKTIDSLKSKAGLSYKERIDKLVSGNRFANATKARELTLTTEFTKNPDNSLSTTTTYRNLTVEDTLLSNQEPIKTILNRIDHTLNTWKGKLSFNTYYEIGTGQERKQEYYYLRVNDGQGVYAWIDSNHDGVEDLSEFAIAAFQDQANYIRVYVPSNEYISTRSNQFSEVFTINPAGRTSSYEGRKPLLHRFSNQFSLRLDRKTREESLLSSLNPFNLSLEDSTLISSTTNVRNTIYFNRTSTVFGLDLTWQENKIKSFLTNGFETRIQRSRIVNLRWNINRSFLATLNYENADRLNSSDFFSNRDYSIFSNGIEPKLSYQPGTSLRIAASYRYGDKKNTDGDLKERAISNRFNLEMKYVSVNAGNITLKTALININYNSEDDSFLSYEMLEGFKNGKNITWGASIQRNINNSMQLSLTYDGRKLQDSPVVHTGGMQFRAFF